MDQGPDRINAEAKRSRALRDGGVVERAAREAKQVVAERNHGHEMAALILGERRRRFPEDQVEAGPEGGQLAAQLMAQVREDGSDLAIDRPAAERLRWLWVPEENGGKRTSMA